ncbi:type II toxin-antitoxin system RelE/ParE family toxin [Thermopetrobacter sp. TC1]|uniref:type II toxin-antitoxin system RelE/ParE family toxin n=1 Tax=Thermopetrobacter sp. TC1 TaxID=1495045 RepID=UPI0005712BBA|nr:type II toxin-antitoxin system RelE/ParE family toxin [Thermopetrobacter sp. TC1]
MRILYLTSARDDLAWLRHFYREVFPDGAARALRHLMAAEGLLRTNPLVGRRTGIGDSRELHIALTPFSLIYRVREDRIEILRVWDGRRDRANLDI